VTLAWGAVATAQNAASEDTLKATHQVMFQAVNAGNVAMIAALVHPQALGFFRESQQIVQLSPSVTATTVVAALITDVSRFSSTPFDSATRVVGNVGIVALTAVQTPKPGTKDKENRYLRSSFVYVYSTDGWKLVSWHTSETPLKKK
jgi:hypothetical protein